MDKLHLLLLKACWPKSFSKFILFVMFDNYSGWETYFFDLKL